MKITEKSTTDKEFLVTNDNDLLGQIVLDKKWKKHVFLPLCSLFDLEHLKLSGECLLELGEFCLMKDKEEREENHHQCFGTGYDIEKGE